MAGRIRELARAKGIPMRHLARRAGISHTHLYLVDAGRVTPTLEVARRIAAALGEPLEAVFPPAAEGPPGGGEGHAAS